MSYDGGWPDFLWLYRVRPLPFPEFQDLSGPF
jgi:hypothetical protein